MLVGLPEARVRGPARPHARGSKKVAQAMKEGIHPEYAVLTVTCACGNKFETRSTRKEVSVDVCGACHPFYTGTQKFVDTAGRVDKFQQRLAKTQAAQAAAAIPKKKKK